MYYEVSKYAANHEYSKIYDANRKVDRFFYAPLSLVFFGWMPHLPYEYVKVIWVLLQTGAYLFFWVLLLSLYPMLKENFISFFLIWLISIKPIHASFQSHNIQLMIAAFLLYAERLSNRGFSRRSFGALISTLLGMIKVFPLFMACFYTIKNGRRALFGVFGGIGLALLLPAIYLGSGGWSLYRTFYSNLHSFHDAAPLLTDAVTLSLASGLATWLSPWFSVESVIPWIKVTVLILSVIFFLFMLRKELTRHHFALALSWMTLLNSSTRPDYFIFFIPGFCSGLELSKESRLCFKLMWIFSALSIFFISEFTLGSFNHPLELMRIPVVGMIVLCTGLFIVTFRR